MRVLHLTGSAESAFLADLSRLYARDCLALRRADHGGDDVVAYVDPEGGWRFPDALDRAAVEAAPRLEVGEALARIGALAPDVALPQMFCVPGMTSYRALLDVLGIPFVGNPADVMALAADKQRARAVVAAAGVAVPAGEVLRGEERPTLPPPAVVKPVGADNSAGVALVQDDAGWDGALAGARAHGDAVLVEAFVPLGREVRVGVLEREDGLRVLPLEEYAVPAGVRTADDKLARADDGELRLVAKDPSRAWTVGEEDPAFAAVAELARTCHVALGCRDYSLHDVRIDPEGRPWFLEASLYCSFSRQSVLAVMAAADGVPTHELLAGALRRRAA